MKITVSNLVCVYLWCVCGGGGIYQSSLGHREGYTLLTKYTLSAPVFHSRFASFV